MLATRILLSVGKIGSSISHFPPKNPNWEEAVKKEFKNQGFMETIGAKLTKISPGFCEISVPFSPKLTQQHGFFHAGVVGTIADNVSGFASLSLMPKGSTVLTVEYKLNLMSPADGSLLIARGNVVKPGKNLHVASADVFIVKKDENGKEHEKLVATCLQTLMAMHNMEATLSSQNNQ